MPDAEEQVELQDLAQGRPIWSGTVTFGLVSVPVNIMPANRPRPIALHMVSDEGQAVPRSESRRERGPAVGDAAWRRRDAPAAGRRAPQAQEREPRRSEEDRGDDRAPVEVEPQDRGAGGHRGREVGGAGEEEG